MRGASEAIVGKIHRLYHRTLPVLREGGVAVGFDDKGERTAQMLLFFRLLGGKHLADTVYSLVAHEFKQIVGLLPCLTVVGIFKSYLSRKPGRMTVCSPVNQIALRIGGDESVVGKYDIGLDVADDLKLTVVADKEEVCLFKHSRFLGSVDYLIEPALGVAHSATHLFGEQTCAVTIAVNVAGVKHEQVGLVLSYDVADASDKELVGRGMGTYLYVLKIRGAALVVKLLGGSGAQKRRLFGVVGRLGPVFGDKVVNVGVASGNRPEHRRGGKSRPLCRGKDIGAFYIVGKPCPGYVFKLTGTEFRVVCHAVLVGIAAGRH